MKAFAVFLSFLEIFNSTFSTYKLNFPDHNLYCKDIRKIKSFKTIKKVDILTSGFPCQAFSVAGYRNGFRDPRGDLFFETARFIKELKPKAFLLENVKNLKSHNNGKTRSTIKKIINEELKYSYIPFILNAKDFSDIPQNRERIYIVGFKDEELFDVCTQSFRIPFPISRKVSIEDLILKNKQDSKFYYDKNHKYYEKLKEAMTKKTTIYQWRRKYVRENKNNVCPTLTANMGTGGHNVPLIFDDFGFRKLTPLECLRFQGFPDNFQFPKNLKNNNRYKQIGNSVVVPLIKKIAIEIINALNQKYKHKNSISYSI